MSVNLFCVFNFFPLSLSYFLETGQDEGGGNNGPSNGGNGGSNLPHSNSAASLHHLTAGNVPLPGAGHHSGSSIDASSADLQHKVIATFASWHFNFSHEKE